MGALHSAANGFNVGLEAGASSGLAEYRLLLWKWNLEGRSRRPSPGFCFHTWSGLSPHCGHGHSVNTVCRDRCRLACPQQSLAPTQTILSSAREQSPVAASATICTIVMSPPCPPGTGNRGPGMGPPREKAKFKRRERLFFFFTPANPKEGSSTGV